MMADGLHETLLQGERELTRLREQVRKLRSLAAVPAPPGFSADTSVADPEFIITGADRGGRGKRIYASRHLTGTRFGQQEIGLRTMWTLGVGGMENMLIIDNATYEGALNRLSQIWSNWDAEERGKRGALYAAPAGTGPDDQDWTRIGETEGGIQYLLDLPREIEGPK